MELRASVCTGLFTHFKREEDAIMTRGEGRGRVVTHLYELASSFHQQELETALFLRAEREASGRRTFRMIPGEPLPTSYGADSYRRVFGVTAR